ncbi:MAG: 4Fe-4S dicluster domain-containing protein [Candidatus Bathyarchaeia archaeon]
MKKIIYDANLCNWCRICTLACTLAHASENIIDHKISKIRIRVNKKKMLSVAEVCVQCEEAPCIEACPVNALSKDNLGRIAVNSDLCTRCGSCVNSCSYHGITLVKDRIIVCDLCGGDPLCAKWCPTKAISYIEFSAENIERIKELRNKMINSYHKVISI